MKPFYDRLHRYSDAIDKTVWEPKDGPSQIIREVTSLKRRGGTVFFIGNGASATIASHMALDWEKRGDVQARCFNDAAALTAYSNDCGYEEVFVRPLKANALPGDILFAISSSGRSLNILRAVKEAEALQMTIITLSGFERGNPLHLMGDFRFYVPSSEYGPVESAHVTILHSILDEISNG